MTCYASFVVFRGSGRVEAGSVTLMYLKEVPNVCEDVFKKNIAPCHSGIVRR